MDVVLPVRVSARGVIAGALVGLAVGAMLLALGAAVGVSALRGSPGGRGPGIAVGVWFIVSFAASAFGGSWVASGSARALRARDGVLHGIVTWAVMALVSTPVVGAIMRAVASAGLRGDPALAMLGAWGAFVAIAVAFGTAIAGGLAGVARERRVVGLASERAGRQRRPIVVSPRHTGDLPLHGPLPQT